MCVSVVIKRPVRNVVIGLLTHSRRFAAGFFSGVVGSLAANPFDLVRVRQQSMALDGMKGAPSVIREVLSNRGSSFLSLYSGWQVNCLRAGLFTGGSMMSYELVKSELNSVRGGPEDFWTHTIAGGVMGIVGTILYMPADAVRTAIYNQSARGVHVDGRTAALVAEHIYRTGGLARFWRGTLPAAARTVPACTLFPVAMEQSRFLLGLDYF